MPYIQRYHRRPPIDTCFPKVLQTPKIGTLQPNCIGASAMVTLTGYSLQTFANALTNAYNPDPSLSSKRWYWTDWPLMCHCLGICWPSETGVWLAFPSEAGLFVWRRTVNNLLLCSSINQSLCMLSRSFKLFYRFIYYVSLSLHCLANCSAVCARRLETHWDEIMISGG